MSRSKGTQPVPGKRRTYYVVDDRRRVSEWLRSFNANKYNAQGQGQEQTTRQTQKKNICESIRLPRTKLVPLEQRHPSPCPIPRRPNFPPRQQFSDH